MALEDAQRQRDALAAFEAGGVPLFKKTPQQIETLIDAAGYFVGGRDQGLTDDQTIQRIAQNVFGQANKQGLMTPQMAEQLLEARGLGMNENDIKSRRQIAREEGELGGYQDEDQRAFAEGSDSEYRNADSKRKALRTLRNQKRAAGGKENARSRAFREAREKELEEALEKEKQRDFGISRARAENAADTFDEDPDKNPTVIQAGTPSTIRDRRSGETIGESFDERLQNEARNDRQAGVNEVIRNQRFVRGELDDREMAERARLQAGRQAREEKLLAIQGPREPGSNFGLGMAVDGVKPIISSSLKASIKPEGAQPSRFPANLAGEANMPVRADQKFPRVSPEDSQAAILDQLRERRERGRSGAVDRRQRENAIAYIDRNVMEGAGGSRADYLVAGDGFGPGVPHSFRQRSVFGPDISGLGKALGVGADMGVTYGSQRPIGNAVRVEDGNGSAYYVDPTTGELAGNISFGPEAKAVDTATELNAPRQTLTARGFIDQNVFDNYGAASFGDEGVLYNMMNQDLDQRGSGGGIPQVSISGETDAFRALMAKKLRLEQGPQMRSAEDLDAAAQQYIAAQGPKKKFYRMDNGNQVFVENPGLEEVFYDMKMSPAEQKGLANALYQLEQAKRTGVNLDAKNAYFEGGRFAPQNYGGFQVDDGAELVSGVNDPARGGDSLQILKGNKDQQAAFRKSTEPDAAKPFVGRTPELNAIIAAEIAAGKRGPEIHDRVLRGIPADKVRPGMETMFKGNKKRDPVSEEKRIRQAEAGNRRVAERQRLAEMVEAKAQGNFMGQVMPKREMPGFKQDVDRRGLREGLNIVEGGANLQNVQVPAGYQPKQPIQQAAVPQTIAPTPGDTTGNKFGAMIDAGIGKAREFGDRAREFATSPKFQRNRRTAYGVGGGFTGAVAGIAGLDALINGEREEREQEAMYQ